MNNVSKTCKYAATLEPTPAGNISCVLSGSFQSNLLNFDIPALPGENNAVIRFRELLLKKAND